MSDRPLSENERALWRQETRDFEQEIEKLEAENKRLRAAIKWAIAECESQDFSDALTWDEVSQILRDALEGGE